MATNEIEECLAYSVSPQGLFFPVVAILKANLPPSYRDLSREDLLRIKDSNSVPGGWFVTSQSNLD